MPKSKPTYKPLTWAEIDLSAVRYNLKQIVGAAKKNTFRIPTRSKTKNRFKPVETILAVVKADAYGHGMDKIAAILNREGVGFFGASDIREGIQLRKSGIKRPILLFESTLANQARDIVDYNLMPTVCTMEMARSLNRYAKRRKKRIDIHIKVDTGMSRLGVWHEEAYGFIQKIHKLSNLRIMGLFTHFPAADTDRSFTREQFGLLYELIIKLDKSGIIVPFIHAANSMGLAGYRSHIVNLSRPGLMLYGLYPHKSLVKKIRLKPVLKVQSRVIFLKKVSKGRSVSYGRTFFTKRDIQVATIPIGYNDGYFRALSNKASVIIGGKRCPVIGRVTMDQIMVDVTKVKSVKLGDLVTVLGAQKKECITADELAGLAGTINYEIVCSLGNRLPRVYT